MQLLKLFLCVFSAGKCFLYCNGLMDHIYVCQNGTSCSSWYRTPTHFSGTLVSCITAAGFRWFFNVCIIHWDVYFGRRMLLWKSPAMRDSALCGVGCHRRCEFQGGAMISAYFWGVFVLFKCSLARFPDSVFPELEETFHELKRKQAGGQEGGRTCLSSQQVSA